jgi:hypothetical protein
MRASQAVGLAALFVAAAAGCSDPVTAPPVEFEASFRHAHRPTVGGTILTGRAEVPPNDSRAIGVAIFKVSRSGNSIRYRVSIAKIENTLMAHIHLAPRGENGGIVVWLRPDGPPAQLIPGRFNGLYAEGTITEESLVGDLAEATVADLVREMRDGNTYVNVHTSQFPGGEIRGQIKVRGHGRHK